ncbi:hypothetical protein QJQ45_016161 [Haematococcus lacustris]|nr:hypothetical protein QJQ45_016161 [Haematococcus lacustris]
MQAQQMQQSTLAAPSFAQQTPQPLAGRQAQATIVKLALGMADYTPAAGSVKAVSEAVKASAEGRAPTSDLIQARRAGKNKRTAQPSMAEAIKHHAERQAAQTDRMELLRQQRDAERDYQRRLQAWETECSRVRSTAAAADRDAVLKHTSIAMEKSNGDMQHYRSWMEVLTRTWEQHKPQLDLPPKPEPLPQLPQRLGPNSSQRAQLGREEAPAEESAKMDMGMAQPFTSCLAAHNSWPMEWPIPSSLATESIEEPDARNFSVKKKVAILPSKPVSVSVGIVLLPLALIVAAISIQQGPADGLVVAKAQAQAQAVGATTTELENKRKFELRARSRIGPA